MASELRRAGGFTASSPLGSWRGRGPTRTSPVCQQSAERRASEKRARPRGGAGCRPLLCLSLRLSVSPSSCQAHTPSDTCLTNRASGCVQAPPRRTELRPSTPPRPAYLVASARVSGLPVSVHPAVLQLFCDAHHPGDRAQAPPRLPRLVPTQPAQGRGVRRSAVHPIPLGTPTASSPCRAVGVQGAGPLPGLHFQHGDPGPGAGPS